MISGTATDTFFGASESEKEERAMPRFRQILAEWEELGARVVASMCDDVFQVGVANPPRWAWYLLFDLDDLDTAAAMIQATREPIDGIRGDRYFRFELTIGRPFWAREDRNIGSLTQVSVGQVLPGL
jgi:hypothetical protein